MLAATDKSDYDQMQMEPCAATEGILMMSHRDVTVLSCVVLAALFVFGCGTAKDPLGRMPISGTVTLDGVPLDKGSIRFEPQTAQAGTPSGAMIDKGRYAIPRDQGLAPGVYRVILTAAEASTENRTADEIMNNPGPRKELIPPSYNRQSKITVEVKAQGANQFDFPIKTK